MKKTGNLLKLFFIGIQTSNKGASRNARIYQSRNAIKMMQVKEKVFTTQTIALNLKINIFKTRLHAVSQPIREAKCSEKL